jgi:hypothetical protein
MVYVKWLQNSCYRNEENHYPVHENKKKLLSCTETLSQAKRPPQQQNNVNYTTWGNDLLAKAVSK